MDLLWEPHPENLPQILAYQLAEEVDEMYYGGMAGGGKTDLGIGLALTKHRKTLILRRQATQLTQIIERLRDLIGDRGRYNGTSKVWRNIDGRRMIELGGCDDEADKEAYKGRDHDLIHFDEASDFTRSMVMFIIGWLRSASQGQHCLVLLTSNPPTTSEGEWIFLRYAAWLDPEYIDPAAPGEKRWYVTFGDKDFPVAKPGLYLEDGSLITEDLEEAKVLIRADFESRRNGDKPPEKAIATSRTFIPASLDDNPFLRDTQYRAQLMKLPDELKDKLLYGDFTAARKDAEWQVIPWAWIEAACKRHRDYVAAHPKWINELVMEQFGVDCARGGVDDNTFSPRYGNFFAPIAKKPGSETKTGAMLAEWVVKELGGENPVGNVDVVGIGSSGFDHMNSLGLRVRPIAANGRDKKARDLSGKLAFVNYRAEMYWKLREALDPNSGKNLMIPDDSELKRDLAAQRWKITTTGIQLMSKEDIKLLIGRSTNKGDALALAHFQPRLGWAQDSEFLKGLSAHRNVKSTPVYPPKDLSV